jgi:hypothetical protein
MVLCGSNPFNIRFSACVIVENSADAGVSAPRDCEHIFPLTRDCFKLTVLEQNQNASHTYLVSRGGKALTKELSEDGQCWWVANTVSPSRPSA